MISHKNRTFSTLLLWGLLLLLFLISIKQQQALAIVSHSKDSKLKVHYLAPYHLNISSQGINRLHIENARINKIVGDSSRYAAVLADNGSDLFLTSKVASLEVIDLTLLLADSKAIDLRAHVKDMHEPAIINIEANHLSNSLSEEKKEAGAMIKKMAKGFRGKYYVQEKKRELKVSQVEGLVLKQYVSYRYGDLVGAGFTYSFSSQGELGKGQKSNNIQSSSLTKDLSPEVIRSAFKESIAIAVSKEEKKEEGKNDELGKVFIVVKAGEEEDA